MKLMSKKQSMLNPSKTNYHKLMSKKQSMLNPSKTNYHKEGTGNADLQHWVLLEEVKE
jgi:hypothetical protein